MRPESLFVQNLTLNIVSHDKLRTFHFYFQHSILFAAKCFVFAPSNVLQFFREYIWDILSSKCINKSSEVPRVGRIHKVYKDLVRSVSNNHLFMNL